MLHTCTKIGSGVAAFCRKLRTAPRVCIFASTAGFTLLEAVLSSVFVAIAGMGVLMMFSIAQTLGVSGDRWLVNIVPRFWIECRRGPGDTLPITPTGICQYQ